MNAIVRKAKKSDIPAMVDLLHDLFKLETDFHPDPEKQSTGLSQLLDKKDLSVILVAVLDNQVIGMCTCQSFISTAQGGPAGFVEDVIVHRDYRNKGIGRMLIDAMKEWAKENGLSRLQLLADKENKPALAFYEHTGWQPTDLVGYRKMLD